MRHRLLASLILAIGTALGSVAAALAGQPPAIATRASVPAKTSTAWTPPRTPWGDPDLQGLWPSTDMQGTPYERPAELAGRTELTDQEYAQRESQAKAQARGWPRYDPV